MRCGVLVHACTDCATIVMIRSPRSLGFPDSPALPGIDAQTDADAASPAANAQQLPFAYARFSFAGNVILEFSPPYQLMVSQVAHG